MKFQKKMIGGYTLLALAFSVLLGGLWYYFTIQTFYNRYQNNLASTAQHLSIQYDLMYDSMRQVSIDVLSDAKTLEAIRALRRPSLLDEEELADQKAVISNRINTDYFTSGFYRIIFFNEEQQIVYSTGNIFSGRINSLAIPPEHPVSAGKNMLPGEPVLTGVYNDYWNTDNRIPVFSMTRPIIGDNLGYIEVQQHAEKLEQLFALPDADMQVLVILPNTEILYHTEKASPLLAEKYSNGFSDGTYRDNEFGQLLSVITTKNRAKILVSTELSKISLNSQKFQQMAFFSILISFLPAFLFIVLMSRHLTKPVREMCRQIDEASLSTLGNELHIHTFNDEFKALTHSYNNLLKRLADSIDQEKKLSTLQLQAQFDLLQAQVNPHFLYNILNVITTRGIDDNDPVICEICGSLASMLRYSTSTLERYASVQNEVLYLQKYFYLMKTRYEDRLETVINIQPEILDCLLPKITLQQIAENSILHGYQNTSGIMKINVIGEKTDDGWYIKITDNGDGISEETLDLLRRRMEETRKKIHVHNSSIEFEIGNMGLVNLYARLYLLYVDKLRFEIGRGTQCGTAVTIYITED